MDEEYAIQLRGLTEAVFCERLFYIMYSQGIFEHNADTIMGKMHHNIRENVGRNNHIEGQNLASCVLYAMDGRLSGKLDGVQQVGTEYIPIQYLDIGYLIDE